MKKIILVLTFISTLQFLSISAFAKDGTEVCGNLRFEAQDFICTLEAKLSDDVSGTSASRNALKRKIGCQNSFINTCKNEIINGASDEICESIKFEAQDLICNLEAKASSDAAGSTEFQDTLKKKLACQNAFLETCNCELLNN